MNEIIEKDTIVVEDMIYEVRGVQVMLSSDVARLYHVETKAINQTIKRNINRFPKTFCFQLTNEEVVELCLRSQFVTLNKNNNLRGQHYKYLPYVLTEQGVMMLSGLLKSDIAVTVNIQIIEAFVKMRKYFAISSNNEILLNHENRLLKLEKTFDKYKEKKLNKILFEGELYDVSPYYLVKKDNLKLLVNIQDYVMEVIELPMNTNDKKFIYGKNKFVNYGRLNVNK